MNIRYKLECLSMASNSSLV